MSYETSCQTFKGEVAIIFSNIIYRKEIGPALDTLDTLDSTINCLGWIEQL